MTERLTGIERREQIIQAAVELFSRRGFRGTTRREIAEAAPPRKRLFGVKREPGRGVEDVVEGLVVLFLRGLVAGGQPEAVR